ncbi:histidine phosphatase family protein [Pleionea litopenaei]|uniref:Histidine phosphatase family protein n=1 Tax=Pleionea litopenaei TaxID=3070815 RepID=A0AA51RRJ3_9GAMM|nr:histidine phosphatase family protein [Pleionea sp. HL-JVS1]WMS86281.1 histidine phosphatase family protein [Pleionea sp. HL-JVS1]
MTCLLNADARYRAKLLLVRHAKSSWADTALADIDRPLKQRGVSDALLMRSKHLALFSRPDTIVLSSTATRAVATATILFEQSPRPSPS